MRTIIEITSGQPSADPRLSKEACALYKAGYSVIVIYCPLSAWADPFDKQLFKENAGIKWIQAGYHPVHDPWHYRFARIRMKLYKLLYRLIGNKFNAAIRSMTLFSQELTKETVKHKADLYIGHNLGALPCAVTAAKKYQAKVAFDFEDFHRGEDKQGTSHWVKVKQVEDKWVPHLDYATVASPLIGREYGICFEKIIFKTLNNCFSFYNGMEQASRMPDSPLKLFWFSQTIGRNRGLETIIKAMGIMKSFDIRLSLLGNINDVEQERLLAVARDSGLSDSQMNFLKPVSERDIVHISSLHHIGMASEEQHILNRDLCLTNKIFIYLLAANAILFSATKAQSLFLKENPDIGLLYTPTNALDLASQLKKYLSNPLLLQTHRINAYRLARNRWNWDQEKQILLSQVYEILEK